MIMVWRLWRGPGTARDSSFCAIRVHEFSVSSCRSASREAPRKRMDRSVRSSSHSCCGWTPRRATRSSLRPVVKARTSYGWRRCVDGSRDLGSVTVGLTTPLLEPVLTQLLVSGHRSDEASRGVGSNSRCSGPPSFAHECRRRTPRRSVAQSCGATRRRAAPSPNELRLGKPFAHECRRRMPRRSLGEDGQKLLQPRLQSLAETANRLNSQRDSAHL